MRRRHKRRYLSSTAKEIKLDLTPLVDIIFLLLIFFMVSTTFIKNETALKISLPHTIMGEDLQNDKFFTISVDKENQIAFKGHKTSIADLEKKISHLPPGKPVVIKADKVSQHGVVTKIMDILIKYNITNFSFATEKEGYEK